MYVTLACLGTIAATSEVRPLNVLQTSRLRAYLFGLLLTTALPMTWLLVAVPFPDLWESLVRIPTQLYADFRSLPLPSPYEMILDKLAGTRTRPLRDLTVYLPPGIGILGAVLAAKDWMAFRRRVPSAPRVRGVPGASYDAGFAAWVALCLLFCLKGAVRTEFLHMLPALVIASVVVVMMASRRWRTASAAVAVIVVACAAVRIDTVVRRSIELHAASMPTSLWPYAVRLAGGCGNPHGRRLGCFRLDTGSSAALDYLLANPDVITDEIREHLASSKEMKKDLNYDHSLWFWGTKYKDAEGNRVIRGLGLNQTGKPVDCVLKIDRDGLLGDPMIVHDSFNPPE